MSISALLSSLVASSYRNWQVFKKMNQKIQKKWRFFFTVDTMKFFEYKNIFYRTEKYRNKDLMDNIITFFFCPKVKMDIYLLEGKVWILCSVNWFTF